ncbi:hypothetical protein M1247_04430 [Mycobacterium sp. 21AC1]|uniref:hypothetical protein n=1 Tax=[Mycobacterium] appelbergii TaxID=2939269 RepID=UPI002938D189|nr:hypothetical protein [Mycobacterium sp. 21AC1]MDV3124149.1 hypothetical protein [Mycobacterium sp. 21AC1]
MQLAVRSYLATGVAVAGVGALAVSPLAPPMPDVSVPVVHSSAAVELSSLVNPIEGYAAAFTQAFQNTVALGQRVADNPAPILSQIVKNQLTSAAAIGTFVDAFGSSLSGAFAEAPEQLKLATEQFAAGDVSGALTTVQNALLGPVVQAVFDTLFLNPDIWAGFQGALRQPIANALAVVDLLSVNNVGSLLGPLLAPVQLITDVTGAVGTAGDDLFAGVKAGDFEQVANAVLSLGPNLTQAILNGAPGSGDFGAGLLGPQGIVAGLLTIRDLVAEAITPPAATTTLTGLAAAPAVTKVTLDVAPQAPALEAPKTGTETGAAESASGAESTPATEAAADAPAAPAEAPAEAPEKEATAVDTAGTAVGNIVKESPKAVPGKTGTSVSTKKVNPLKNVRDGIRGALKNVNQGVKDAVSGLSGKTAKQAKSESSAKTGGSADSSGGSSSAGGSSAGGAD